MHARDPRLPPELPAANPYAAPTAVVADIAPGTSEAEAIRQAHIRHERQIKSIGSLYYVGAVAMGAAAIAVFTSLDSKPDAFLDLVMLVYAGFAAAFIALGRGFRRLRPWVRVPGGILSAFGLLAIPVGTIINGWILFAMFGPKGQVVLAPGYDAIVAATPHVRYRWSIGDKIATGIMLALLLGFAALMFVAVRGR